MAKHVLDTFFFSSRLVYDKQRTEPRDLECMRMTPFFFLLFLYQKGRDGVTSAQVLAYGGDTVEGISYYTIEYQSSSSRGDKHFISKVTIVDKKVPTPPCSPPPPIPLPHAPLPILPASPLSTLGAPVARLECRSLVNLMAQQCSGTGRQCSGTCRQCSRTGQNSCSTVFWAGPLADREKRAHCMTQQLYVLTASALPLRKGTHMPTRMPTRMPTLIPTHTTKK